jgi:hypothetical protein
MRRVVLTALALVMLLSVFVSSALADEPKRTESVTAQLGEVWMFYFSGFSPGEPVDAYMYRPSTLEGWPWPGDPPLVGDWWWTGPASQARRQSWPDWTNADKYGYFFTMFLLPRDEVWFPCSFPLKWQCNYVINPLITEWHSPATQPFELGLTWPWAGNPMDTVSPVEVWLLNEHGVGWIIPFEVTGYYWKWSDLK